MQTQALPDPQSYWRDWQVFQPLPDGPERRRLGQKLRAWRRESTARLVEKNLAALLAERDIGPAWQTWFWFNHFNVLAGKSQIGVVLPGYVQDAIEPHLGGRFVDLLTAVSLHPAMLMYLDNVRNVKGRGNENQARELLELHTLGVSQGYAQADVVAAAKMLSGWGVRLTGDRDLLGTAEFSAQRHEGGDKRVMGQTFAAAGAKEAEQLMAFLAAQPATARHLATRMCQWGLADRPAPAAVSRLVEAYRRERGSLPAMWNELRSLRADAQRSAPKKFKDPLRYVITALQLFTDGRSLQDLEPVARWVRLLGQGMYQRTSPDGYPLTGEAWLNAGQLSQRVELAQDMVRALARAPMDKAVADRIDQHPFQSRTGAVWRDRLSRGSRAVIEKAGSSTEAWAFLLASPEFMYE